LGEAAVIAERTGLPVISDFRARDVAAGGEGAPLVPLVDWLLFRARDRVRGLLNLGGIANLTIVPPSLEEVYAFDTGPGNMPLDLVCRASWHEPFDRDGSRAASGSVDPGLLAEFLLDPFFAQPPPRSTGREVFGAGFVEPLLTRFRGRERDLLATLTALSAEAVHHAYRTFVVPRSPIQELIVSGGGVHNRTLMGHLARHFAPVSVRSLAELGMDPDAKEAVAFAVLANESLFANPGNLPAATGASGSRILGKITL
jgi:anhydro-N-acetylmuramic acid kinase